VRVKLFAGTTITQLPKKFDNLTIIVQNKIKRVGTNVLFV